MSIVSGIGRKYSPDATTGVTAVATTNPQSPNSQILEPVEQLGDISVFRVTESEIENDLDAKIYTADGFSDEILQLCETPGSKIIIDFSNVDFLSSVALSGMIKFHRNAEVERFDYRFYGLLKLGSQADEILRTTYLHKLFRISENCETAKKELKGEKV